MPDIYSLVTQPPKSLISYDAQTRALLQPIRQYLTKIEWLDWEENFVGNYTADVLDGSLMIDSSRDCRRSFSMTLNNANGLYIPNGVRTNMGIKVQIKRGIITPTGAVYPWNRGIFVLSDPIASHKGAEKTVDLEGLDKWALLDGTLGGELTETIMIPIGTNIADAIRAVASDAGETKFAFDICTAVTPYTITREMGETRADLIKELALIPSWEIYYDVNGYLRFRPLIDPLQKQIIADLSVGGIYRKIYVAGEYNPQWSQIKNYWKVQGYSDPDTGIIYDGIAQDNNPDSPTNTFSPPDGIGLKTATITDENLTTDSLCEQRAAYELRKNLTKIDRSSHEIIPLPFLNEGDCVKLEDSANGITRDKYEIQSITEPLRLGNMKIECWQCKSVFEIVAYDDFQTGLGDWIPLQSGAIDIYGFSGNNCMRKNTYADPNGGYRLLNKACTDFEFVVFTRRDETGIGKNSYSVTDSSGNGYGISLDFTNNLLSFDKRIGWEIGTLGSTAVTLSFATWYTLRLNKLGNNFIAEVYEGKTLDFTSPLATISGFDTDYISFDREAVNGGYLFFTDEPTVRKLL